MDKKNHKKVCVLLASYNGKTYLPQQINSLLAQTGVDVDILVRDDGSGDGTQELLDQWQSQGYLKWYNGERKGAVQSFWDLLEHAPSCDYYAFCDQDDVWDKDKLSAAVNAMEKIYDKKYMLYCCGARLVDANLNFIKVHTIDLKRTQYARLFMSSVAGNTMVFNKALKDRLIQYHPKHMEFHDTWVYKSALCLGAGIILDPSPHLDYRQHNSNAVGMELSLMDMVKKFVRVILNKNIYGELAELKTVFCQETCPEYLSLIEQMEAAKSNMVCRVQLAFDRRIRFNNFFFHAAFAIKVLIYNF